MLGFRGVCKGGKEMERLGEGVSKRFPPQSRISPSRDAPAALLASPLVQTLERIRPIETPTISACIVCI